MTQTEIAAGDLNTGDLFWHGTARYRATDVRHGIVTTKIETTIGTTLVLRPAVTLTRVTD